MNSVEYALKEAIKCIDELRAENAELKARLKELQEKQK